MGEKTDWNLSLLFKSDDDPNIGIYQKKIKEKVDKFVSKWTKREDYLSNSSILKEALDEYVSLQIVGPSGGDGAGTKDAFYFWLRTQQEQNNAELKAKYSKSMDFANNLLNSLRFFRLNISNIKKGNHSKILKSKELKEYAHFIEKAFLESKYNLSLESENIIALKAGPAHEQWNRMLTGFLSKEEREIIGEDGNKVIKNFSEITSLLKNHNKITRDSAALAFNDILNKNLEIAEAEINALLANKKIDDDLRKANRPDLIRHISDDIESEVVDSMIAAVVSRFDISKRFYSLKSKLLGVEKLEYHERSVDYGEIKKKYSYVEAQNLVRAVFNDLDYDFVEIFDRMNKNGQVDVFPKKGKRSGAFCTDSLLYQPTYILLNHTDELNDVLTIAHEFGHAINSELMKKERDTLSCGMVLSTAEVASTFMEDFVLERLLKNANDEERLSLLMSRLNDEVSTIIRQVACYRFEQELHNSFRAKGYLSKEEIGKIFQSNMADYMGDFVEQSNGSENWWVHWNHIRSFFYVYSYASGLLISKAMQAKVRKDKKFILKVKEFLSTGTSDSPQNIFKKLGIDITNKKFWILGIKETEHLLDEAEALAKKLGKI